LEFIPKDTIYEFLFGEPLADVSSAELKDIVLESAGFSKDDLFKSIFLVVVAGIVVTLLIALAVLVSKTLYHRLPETAQKVFTSLKNKLMFNSVLHSLLQSYLPLCISSFVQLKYNEPNKSVAAYILLSLLCLCPFAVMCILRRQKHPLCHPKMKATIGSLYLNVDTADKPLALLFTPAFLVRRIVFALVAVFAENVLVQLFVTMYASLALIAYYVMV